jgi:hypothetical protein
MTREQYLEQAAACRRQYEAARDRLGRQLLLEAEATWLCLAQYESPRKHPDEPMTASAGRR